MNTATVHPIGEWAECQRVADLPDVEEALRGLIDDPTGDNATCLVRAVLRAAPAAAALAKIDTLLTVNGKSPKDAAETERLVAAHVRMNRELGGIIHDITVGNQAAWIEWRHGNGAEAAMQWIENGLDGPGMIPGESDDDIAEDDPILKNAQAYFDRHSTWSKGYTYDGKIATKLRNAKTDTALLNFMDAGPVVVDCVVVPALAGHAPALQYTVLHYRLNDPLMRPVGQGATAREALREAIRATAPQGELFAENTKGSAS